MESRARQAIGSLLCVSLVLALAASARADGPLPRLAGPAFTTPAHLHLILAGAPPAIVDLDTGIVHTVPGVTTSEYAQVRLVAMPGGALAIVHQACRPCATATITYATNAVGFRIGVDGSVERLGAGWSFVPARSSTAVWVLRRDARRRCRLWLVPSSRPSLPAPCGFLQQDDGAAGLLTSTRAGDVFLDTRTGAHGRRAVAGACPRSVTSCSASAGSPRWVSSTCTWTTARAGAADACAGRAS